MATAYTASIGSRFNHGLQPGGNYLTDYDRPSYAPWPENNVRPRVRDVDAQNLATTALRGWRFPASRRFLWDRTPQEAGVTVCATDFLPDTEMMHTAFMAASQFLTSGTSTKSGIRLSGKWAMGDDGKITLKLEKLDHSLPQGDRGQGLEHTLISCMKQGGEAAKAIGQLIRMLSDRFALTMDQCKETAKVSSLYPIRCTSEISSQSLFIEGKILCPNGMLSMTPLFGKRVFDIPLARSLYASMQETTMRPQTGFMSMDQGRALVPMLPEDAVTNGKPIVGLWVSGVKSVVHPLVIAGCYMLRNSTLLKDKAFEVDGAFLLLFYGQGAHSHRLFECRIEGDGFSLYKFSASSNLRPDPRGKVKIRLELDVKNALAEATHVEDPGLDTLARPIGRKSPGPSVRGGSPPSMEMSMSQSASAPFESKIPVPPGLAAQVQQNHKSNPWEEPSLVTQAKLDPVLAQSRPPRPPNNAVRPTLVLNGAPTANGSQSTSFNPSSQRAGQNFHTDPSSLNFPWKNERVKATAGQTVTPVWQSNLGSSQPQLARSTHPDAYSFPWKNKDRSKGQVTGRTDHQDQSMSASWSSNVPPIDHRLNTPENDGNVGEVKCGATGTRTSHMGMSQERNGAYPSQNADGIGVRGSSPCLVDRPGYLSSAAPSSAPPAAVHTAPSPRHHATWNQSSVQHGNRTPRGMGATSFTPSTTSQAATQMNQPSTHSNDAGRGFHEPQYNSWSYQPQQQIKETPPPQTSQPRTQAQPEPPRSLFTFMPDSGGTRSTTQSGPARLRTQWTSEGIPRGDPSQNPLRAAALAQQSQRRAANVPAKSRFSEPPVRASSFHNISQTAPPAYGHSRQFMPPRPPMSTNWMSAVQTSSSSPAPAGQNMVTSQSAPPLRRPEMSPQSQDPQREAANVNVHTPMTTFNDSPAALPPGWAELSNDPDVLKMEVLQLREKVAMLEREVQRQASEKELKAHERATAEPQEMTGFAHTPGVQDRDVRRPLDTDSIPGTGRAMGGESQNQIEAQNNVRSQGNECKAAILNDEPAIGVEASDFSEGVRKPKSHVRRECENEVVIDGERAVQISNPHSSFELSSDARSSDNEHEYEDDNDDDSNASDDDFLGSGDYDDTKSETSSSSSGATSVGTHDWDELATYELEAGSETDDERIYRKYGMECFDHYPPYWWLPQDMSFDSLVHMEKIGCITNSAKAWENQGKPLPKIEARGGLTFEQAMKRRNKCRKKKHAFKKQHEEKYLKDLLGEEKIVTTLEKKMMRITEGKKKSDDKSSASSASSDDDDEKKSEKKKKMRKRSQEKKRAEEKRLKQEERKRSKERSSKKKKSTKKRDEMVNASDVTFQGEKGSSSKSSNGRKTRKSSGRSKSK